MANYVPAVRTGNLLFVSGQICHWNGERRFVGKLGAEISARATASRRRGSAASISSPMSERALDGDLDRVVRVVRLGGFVNCSAEPSPSSRKWSTALRPDGRGASATPGRHARTAVGVSSLPGGARGRGRRGLRGALSRSWRMAAGRCAACAIVERSRAIPAAEWDACAGRGQSLRRPRLPGSAGGKRLGHARDRLAAAAHPARGRATAASSAPCRCISRAIPTANTSSTTAGPRPMSAPAAAITRSCGRGAVHAGDRAAAAAAGRSAGVEVDGER